MTGSANGSGRGAIGRGLLAGGVAGLVLALIDVALVRMVTPADLLPALRVSVGRAAGVLLPLGAAIGVGVVLLLRGAPRAWGPGTVVAVGGGIALALTAYGVRFLGAARWLPGGPGMGAALLAGILAVVLFGWALRRWPANGLAGWVLGVVLLAAWGLSLDAGRRDRAEGFPEVQAGADPRPNVVLIVLDTTRRDRMSLYGASPTTTPQIDTFAETATVYDNVLSPAPWTLPSHASLFTGLPASAHGCSGAQQVLNPGWATLAERLSRAGYQTVGLSANHFVSASRFFDQGFDHWENPSSGDWRLRGLAEVLAARLGRGRGGGESQAAALHRRLAAWLRSDYQPRKPLFVFLNYMEPHAPYRPPVDTPRWMDAGVMRAWAGRNQFDLMNRYIFTRGAGLSEEEIGELSRLYDEEIGYLDARLGELFAYLDRSGLGENALIAVTSDHGEHFGEHNMMDHLYTLYEPLVRVPLVVRYPDRATGRVTDLVQMHDLFATILDEADVPWEASPAQNAVNLRTPDANRVGVSELEVTFLANVASWCTRMPQVDYSPFLAALWAVQKGPYKLIVRDDGGRELFDLRRQSPEAANLVDELPEVAGDLEQTYRTLRRRFSERTYPEEPYFPERPIGEDELERLRSLGYLN